MRSNRILSIIAAALTAAVLFFPAAAQTGNASLEERRLQIEQKYGVGVRYDADGEGKAVIGPGDLATLDMSLGAVTANVVRQVSEYYRKKTGNRLTFVYTYSKFDINDEDLQVLGYFDERNATIELCLPSGKRSVSSGSSPLTIVHEFAHAYHRMVEEMHGAERMEREWTALNGSVSNNEGYMVYPYNKVAFMSSYAASNYREDFAETFAHTFVRNKEGQGFYHRLLSGERKTALGRKVDYLIELLPKYLTGTEAAVNNLRKIYSTPVFLNFQGLRLSGEELQFIGCSSPKNVLSGILNHLGVSPERSEWISAIGGWYVETASGEYYLAFPGGVYSELAGPLQAAA